MVSPHLSAMLSNREASFHQESRLPHRRQSDYAIFLVCLDASHVYKLNRCKGQHLIEHYAWDSLTRLFYSVDISWFHYHPFV